MIWVCKDGSAGEYGLKLFEAEDPDSGQISLEDVVEPFDDLASGCDWAALKPQWMGDHGTVIVLTGC